MNVYPLVWTVDQLHRRRAKINPTPAYQRGPVGNHHKKRLLIDSILRGYDIPKFYVRRIGDPKDETYEIVDGQQRTLAIWDFMENNFELDPSAEPFSGLGDLSGLF